MSDNKQKNQNQNEEYVYKKVILDKHHSRAWSVASFVAALISPIVSFCGVEWLGIALSLLAVVFSVISRKNIGYFDRFSIAGLIIGIIGVVFAVACIILGYVFVSSGFNEIWNKIDGAS